ncbi:MAG: hypothetical protein COV91_05285 [Candidatus Taylorbacteria bacterium CG11_big_fil_rev_8_21_14_0_20_46_11]|uniref:Response regulatory domain-containing protein n=1 Tax=Candidatus Taylorbacteria bacterium CG11_big_fil_rev_8_21_14_0_20_46_11 TaxID=1975025 RepID=A0A2H0KAC4_9BACT|nr:MAG: hypothetical protein COV91_05285 [Candidatus Taylorbacteria bacterium CG11_big_fil_rev_8_21_14_0_20_46_11]
MHILIVDDSALWIKQGKTLLEQAGYEVTGLVVSNPKQFTSESLSESVADALKGADVLMTDKDLGEAVTSTRLICVVRHNFPKLPIVRWTGGYDNKPYMKYLGVTSIEKPTKNNEAKFVETFNKALDEQKLILSGAMGIYAVLDETAEPDKHAAESKANRLRQIAEIAQLAEKNRVSNSGNSQYDWTITGRSGDVTKHELGHCVCDGDLTAEDIGPHLTALRKVIGKFEAASEIDNRFKTCAEFIKAGNLDELELVRHCY